MVNQVLVRMLPSKAAARFTRKRVAAMSAAMGPVPGKIPRKTPNPKPSAIFCGVSLSLTILIIIALKYL